MQIEKKNEVYLILKDLEPSTSQELSSFFTFEVPGAKFMPMYRNRMWDGKIRLFSPGSGEIYVGLLPYIKKFCDRNNVDYIIGEGVEDDRDVVREVVKGFVKSLKPKSKGKSLKIRDYQIDAVHHAIARNRALLVSPTASGKSLIIYALVRYYHMMGLKTLILVPTTSLVEQMYTDFEDYGWSSGTYCQKIYQGHDRKVTRDVVISTWQSIYKMPKKYFEQFGCIIGDEAHLFKAKSLTGIMTKLHQCKYRFGLTGTLDGTQTHQLVLEGLFGAVENIITTKKLIDSKTLADLKIKCIILKHSNIREKMAYAEELQYLVGNENRNKFIQDLLLHIDGNTLCLFQLVEKHGQILYDQVKDAVKDRKVFFVYGGTDARTREDIRSIVEKEKKSIIIASYGTFSTGINIRNINNIVLASPSKSKIRVLQSIGRGLRLSESKSSILVFDIADDMTYKRVRNFTLTHFMERINIYAEQQFVYEISKVNLK
ncbi:MAG: DEAD/DEAH box helicase family protein [Candidatus Pacebacteria bacterium]|nr:DEAD/DEAH box helicase family protein [Candidatus Paceibacterota bacterium]